MNVLYIYLLFGPNYKGKITNLKSQRNEYEKSASKFFSPMVRSKEWTCLPVCRILTTVASCPQPSPDHHYYQVIWGEKAGEREEKSQRGWPPVPRVTNTDMTQGSGRRWIELQCKKPCVILTVVFHTILMNPYVDILGALSTITNTVFIDESLFSLYYPEMGAVRLKVLLYRNRAKDAQHWVADLKIGSNSINRIKDWITKAKWGIYNLRISRYLPKQEMGLNFTVQYQRTYRLRYRCPGICKQNKQKWCLGNCKTDIS